MQRKNLFDGESYKAQFAIYNNLSVADESPMGYLC